MKTNELEMVREYLLGEYDEVQVLGEVFTCKLEELDETHKVTVEPFENGLGFELIGEHNGRSWEVGMIRL